MTFINPSGLSCDVDAGDLCPDGWRCVTVSDGGAICESTDAGATAAASTTAGTTGQATTSSGSTSTTGTTGGATTTGSGGQTTGGSTSGVATTGGETTTGATTTSGVVTNYAYAQSNAVGNSPPGILFNSDVQAGSLLVVGVLYASDATSAIGPPNDTLGNTWMAVGGPNAPCVPVQSPTTSCIGLWYTLGGDAGFEALTFASPPNPMSASAYEFTGGSTHPTLQSASLDGGLTLDDAGDMRIPAGSATGLPGQALVLGYFGAAHGLVYAGSGLQSPTGDIDDEASDGLQLLEYTQSAFLSATAESAYGAGEDYAAIVASFLP